MWVSEGKHKSAHSSLQPPSTKLEPVVDRDVIPAAELRLEYAGCFFPLFEVEAAAKETASGKRRSNEIESGSVGLQPFPHTNIFEQVRQLVTGDCDKIPFFWTKTVYANDTTGWILRKTNAGWEILRDLDSSAAFVADVDTADPPTWDCWVRNDCPADVVLRCPFRMKGCGGQSEPTAGKGHGGADTGSLSEPFVRH